MPLPQGYLPRRGDLLTILVTVKHDVDPGEPNVFVTLPGKTYKAEFIDLKDVEGLACPHWEQGDRVEWRNNPGMVGEVIAVAKDQVWVKFDEQSHVPTHYQTVPAHELNRVQEPPPAVPAEYIPSPFGKEEDQ